MGQQRVLIGDEGPLSTPLVGISLGTISWMTGYMRYGYGGASMNPARCFGIMTMSKVSNWRGSTGMCTMTFWGSHGCQYGIDLMFFRCVILVKKSPQHHAYHMVGSQTYVHVFSIASYTTQYLQDFTRGLTHYCP